jgi:hypothetical protein
MISSCVNPEFRLLDCADLYAIKRPARAPEFLSICSNRASLFRSYFNADEIVSIQAREDGVQEHSPQLQATLHLVAHARKQMPRHHDVPAGLGPMTDLPGAWGAPTYGAQL